MPTISPCDGAFSNEVKIWRIGDVDEDSNPICARSFQLFSNTSPEVVTAIAVSEENELIAFGCKSGSVYCLKVRFVLNNDAGKHSSQQGFKSGHFISQTSVRYHEFVLLGGTIGSCSTPEGPRPLFVRHVHRTNRCFCNEDEFETRLHLPFLGRCKWLRTQLFMYDRKRRVHHRKRVRTVSFPQRGGDWLLCD